MSPGIKIVLFLFELMTVGSAFLVALQPNILFASVALLFTFLGVAVMFICAGADFIAGTQVIVYVGGVTILILFAIMLTQWMYQMKLRDVGNKVVVPVALGALVFVVLFKWLSQLGAWIQSTPPQNLQVFSDSPKTAVIGEALLNNYLLPFEAITILLLGALVGAVWLARPK
jgi:NADH-quinone oxidoreductase subunit J